MHLAEFFLPEDEMILTSRKLGANKILSSEVFIKKMSKNGTTEESWSILQYIYKQITNFSSLSTLKS